VTNKDIENIKKIREGKSKCEEHMMELDLAPAEREGKRPHYDSIDEDDYEIDVERWAAKKNQHETI